MKRDMPKKTTHLSKITVDKQNKILLQDFCNSCNNIKNADITKDTNKMIRGFLNRLYSSIDNQPDCLKIWVDGSYNKVNKKAGIGIVILADEDLPLTDPKNICLGKTVNAKSSVNAEIYALSIGLSYILDTYDTKNIHIYYDCTTSTVCAANIDAYIHNGAPYTNLKSVLKRIRKKEVNVAFEHTKAHDTDPYNKACDMIAKYYAGISLQQSQIKYLNRLIKL